MCHGHKCLVHKDQSQTRSHEYLTSEGLAQSQEEGKSFQSPPRLEKTSLGPKHTDFTLILEPLRLSASELYSYKRPTTFSASM